METLNKKPENETVNLALTVNTGININNYKRAHYIESNPKLL